MRRAKKTPRKFRCSSKKSLKLYPHLTRQVLLSRNVTLTAFYFFLIVNYCPVFPRWKHPLLGATAGNQHGLMKYQSWRNKQNDLTNVMIHSLPCTCSYLYLQCKASYQLPRLEYHHLYAPDNVNTKSSHPRPSISSCETLSYVKLKTD